MNHMPPRSMQHNVHFPSSAPMSELINNIQLQKPMVLVYEKQPSMIRGELMFLFS